MEKVETEGRVIKLDLNITNKCNNFRCHHCCFDSGVLNMREMTLCSYQMLLNEFKELGGQRIDITGGEPLTRGDVFSIIAHAKHLGLKIELVTNGALLTYHKLKRLAQLGVNDIAISLDGFNYETYSRIRPVSEEIFKKVIDNIKLAVKFGFRVKINTVVFQSNLYELEKICDLAINLGVIEHGFYYFSPIGRGKRENRFDIADPLAWLKIIRENLSDKSDKIKISLEAPILESSLIQESGCFIEHPWHLQILPDGNVYPCAIMCAHQKPLGNLYRQTLGEIWEDKQSFTDYYLREVQPLFCAHGGCVDYSFLNDAINGGEMKFACLCRKFKPEEIIIDG